MKKFAIALTALGLVVAAGAAQAAGSSSMGGLGFHATGSPFDALLSSSLGVTGSSPTLGVREWFNEKVAVDVGLGYSMLKSEPASNNDETITGWTVDLGLPLALKSWDKVHFLFRPGVSFGSLEDKLEPSGGPTTKTKLTTFGVSGELEVEYMLADKLSISASHGLAWNSIKDDASPENKLSSFSTTGSNFTQLGFHVYLW